MLGRLNPYPISTSCKNKTQENVFGLNIVKDKNKLWKSLMGWMYGRWCFYEGVYNPKRRSLKRVKEYVKQSNQLILKFLEVTILDSLYCVRQNATSLLVTSIKITKFSINNAKLVQVKSRRM